MIRSKRQIRKLKVIQLINSKLEVSYSTKEKIRSGPKYSESSEPDLENGNSRDEKRKGII